MVFKVLCIDGGGSKGAISLAFLIEIEKRLGKKISDTFDLFVGTSAGSIIVASLTLKENGKSKFNSCQEILDMFTNNIKNIFYRSYYHITKTMGGLIGPKYESDYEQKTLYTIFKDSKINENTIITANTIDPTIEYFEFNSTINVPILDAIMASSAAPTYYGVHTIDYEGKRMDFVDGGISTNNPSIAGYSEAIKRGYTDIMLVSIGTGYTGNKDSNKCDQGGLLQWSVPISSNMMTTVSDFADYQMHKLLPNNYYRLNIKYNNDKMDITDIAILNDMVKQVSDAINTDNVLNDMIDIIISKL